jgi:hypothetical protein
MRSQIRLREYFQYSEAMLVQAPPFFWDTMVQWLQTYLSNKSGFNVKGGK